MMVRNPISLYFRPWKELSKLPQPFFVLAGAMFVNRMGTMALPFLAIYLTRQLRFSPSQAGFVLALFGATGFIVSPLAGRLSDLVHPVRVMQGSLLFSALFMALFPFANSYHSVIIVTIAWAIASESFRPASLTLRAELAPPDMRKQSQTLLRLANNLGMSVGPAVGGFIAYRSFAALFYVDAITGALASLFMIVFFRAKLSRTEVTGPRRPFFSMLEALRDPLYVPVLAGLMVVMLVFYQHDSTLGLWLVHDLKLTERFFGVLFTINTLLIVALELPINHYTAKWSHRVILPLGALLFAVAWGSLAFLPNAFGAVFSVVVWTFGEMILFPGMVIYVMDIAPTGRRGEYMGLYAMAMSASLIVGPWAGTVVFEKLGATILWIGTFILGLLAAALFTRVRS